MELPVLFNIFLGFVIGVVLYYVFPKNKLDKEISEINQRADKYLKKDKESMAILKKYGIKIDGDPDFKKPNPTKSKSPEQRKNEKDEKKMGIEPVNLNEDLYDY